MLTAIPTNTPLTSVPRDHSSDGSASWFTIESGGKPIGIGAFIAEPDRVRNLLVMNTTVFPMPSEGFTYANFPIRWLPKARRSPVRS